MEIGILYLTAFLIGVAATGLVLQLYWGRKLHHAEDVATAAIAVAQAILADRIAISQPRDPRTGRFCRKSTIEEPRP